MRILEGIQILLNQMISFTPERSERQEYFTDEEIEKVDLYRMSWCMRSSEGWDGKLKEKRSNFEGWGGHRMSDACAEGVYSMLPVPGGSP